MMKGPFGFPTLVFPMSRISRLVVPGMAHHIVQRGSRRLNVFRDEADRLSYVDFFGESCEMFGLVVHAYSLMPNHVHYIAVPGRPDSVAKTSHRAHGMYSNWFNEVPTCGPSLARASLLICIERRPFEECGSLCGKQSG